MTGTEVERIAPERRDVVRRRHRQLSEDDARRLTREVRQAGAALWEKLLRLYNGGAHTALGYNSWAEYSAAELDLGPRYSYQLLDAARVADLVRNSSLPVPATESVARELVPMLKGEPDQVAEIWQGVITAYGKKPTAADVRSYIEQQIAEGLLELRRTPRPKPVGKRQDGGTNTPRSDWSPVQQTTWLSAIDALQTALSGVETVPESAVGVGMIEVALAEVERARIAIDNLLKLFAAT